MKILVIHADDDPEKGPWSDLGWDRIVDIGLGGVSSYARWSQKFRCPVTSLKKLQHGFDDFRKIRNIFDIGSGKLRDDYGLDWWELLSILLHEKLEALLLLQRFAHSVPAGSEVYVSRPGLHADLLRTLLPAGIKFFPLQRHSRKRTVGHYLRTLRKLSSTEIIDVFWDKCDAGYQWRGRLTRKRSRVGKPVVLIPTTYVNVSRMGLAYANTFVDDDFFLVATRRSGWVAHPPPNVDTAWLSSYAAVRDRHSEFAAMEIRWASLVQQLVEVEELAKLHQIGCLDPLFLEFRKAIEIRDAWRNVFDREQIRAVMCGDDSNIYTRIPMLLAQVRGIPNVAVHHGALDGRYFFKRIYGNVIWAKGMMEQDYLVRQCGVPREKIEIVAPALPANWEASKLSSTLAPRPNILFISEVFSVAGGRPEEFYRDILPPLADLAIANGRKLVVKLHPAESKHERAAILARILSSQQQAATLLVSGALTEDLLAQAWFGITILSTVALELAIRGTPCFLCKWLESWAYGYVDQFIRFGIGIGLNDPTEIKKIPEYMQHFPVGGDVREKCWAPADPSRLRGLLAVASNSCLSIPLSRNLQ
jgi:hypothetical protein